MLTYYPLMIGARNEGRSSFERASWNPFRFLFGFWFTGTKTD